MRFFFPSASLVALLLLFFLVSPLAISATSSSMRRPRFRPIYKDQHSYHPTKAAARFREVNGEEEDQQQQPQDQEQEPEQEPQQRQEQEQQQQQQLPHEMHMSPTTPIEELSPAQVRHQVEKIYAGTFATLCKPPSSNDDPAQTTCQKHPSALRCPIANGVCCDLPGFDELFCCPASYTCTAVNRKMMCRPPSASASFSMPPTPELPPHLQSSSTSSSPVSSVPSSASASSPSSSSVLSSIAPALPPAVVATLPAAVQAAQPPLPLASAPAPTEKKGGGGGGQKIAVDNVISVNMNAH